MFLPSSSKQLPIACSLACLGVSFFMQVISSTDTDAFLRFYLGLTCFDFEFFFLRFFLGFFLITILLFSKIDLVCLEFIVLFFVIHFGCSFFLPLIIVYFFFPHDCLLFFFSIFQLLVLIMLGNLNSHIFST